jgi:hypothetical protein
MHRPPRSSTNFGGTGFWEKLTTRFLPPSPSAGRTFYPREPLHLRVRAKTIDASGFEIITDLRFASSDRLLIPDLWFCTLSLPNLFTMPCIRGIEVSVVRGRDLGDPKAPAGSDSPRFTPLPEFPHTDSSWINLTSSIQPGGQSPAETNEAPSCQKTQARVSVHIPAEQGMHFLCSIQCAISTDTFYRTSLRLRVVHQTP